MASGEDTCVYLSITWPYAIKMNLRTVPKLVQGSHACLEKKFHATSWFSRYHIKWWSIGPWSFLPPSTPPSPHAPVFSSYSSQLLFTLLPFPLLSSTLFSSSLLLLLFHILPSSLPPPSFLLFPTGNPVLVLGVIFPIGLESAACHCHSLL